MGFQSVESNINGLKQTFLKALNRPLPASRSARFDFIKFRNILGFTGQNDALTFSVFVGVFLHDMKKAKKNLGN